MTATVVSPDAQELDALAAHRLVARHQQHRAAPGPAQRRVDAGLADRGAVEAQVAPARARDGVVHAAVARTGPGVHAHQQRRVAALLERLGVLRPEALDDELDPLVEVLGQQGVERPAAAGAVAVHDDDLGRAGRRRHRARRR